MFLVGGVALAGSFRGAAGPDEISGTKRADTIRVLAGDDRLMADDGNRDVIRCGGGTDYADLNDKAYHYCETVER